MEIYSGIKDYDYCREEEDKILGIMTEINMLLYRYQGCMSDINQETLRARSLDIARFDFRKACKGYCYGTGGEWSNHHKYM